VIQKYGLTSVKLENFFLGPLPDFQLSGSSHCSPAAVKLPAVNGCLPPADHRTSDKGGVVVNDIGVIDLTDDDVEAPAVRTSSAIVAKKHVVNTKIGVVQKNNHKKQPGRSVGLLTVTFVFASIGLC